jgi:hypothetical protein
MEIPLHRARQATERGHSLASIRSEQFRMASHHAPVDSKYPSSIADAEMLYFEYRLMKRDGSHHVPIFTKREESNPV